MKAPVAFRPGKPSDVPLILSSWLKSYRSAPAVREVPSGIYFANEGHWGVVNRCLSTGNVLVACDPEHEDDIFGWACFDHALLHYVYVKQAYRPFGLAAALLERAGLVNGVGPLTITHSSPGIHAAIRHMGLDVIYNPYLLGGV